MPRFSLLAGVLALVTGSASGAEIAFKFTDAKNQPVGDVVVSLVSLDGSAKPPPVPQASVIAQEKQEFLPYVLPVQVGTAINFPNRDTVQHHVYSSSKTKKFELPLYAGEAREAVLFDRPGVVTLGCNIHDWMLAYVVVVETPWFAKSDETGAAIVTAVPAGRYRAEIWQPRLAAVLKRDLTIADAPTPSMTISLELRPDRRIRRNLDVKGGGYK